MAGFDFSPFLEPVANTSAPAAVQAAPVAPVAVVKPEIKVVKKSVEETSTFDFSDYLEAVTDVLTAPPQAPAPVSEDPDRQFFQSGVGMEDRTFEPELGAADVATDLQVMEPPVDTAAPEAPVEFSFPTAGVTASSDLTSIFYGNNNCHRGSTSHRNSNKIKRFRLLHSTSRWTDRPKHN